MLQDGRVMIAGGDDRNADGATALDQVRRAHFCFSCFLSIHLSIYLLLNCRKFCAFNFWTHCIGAAMTLNVVMCPRRCPCCGRSRRVFSPLLSHFYTKHDQFTKTGSGQTYAEMFQESKERSICVLCRRASSPPCSPAPGTPACPRRCHVAAAAAICP